MQFNNTIPIYLQITNYIKEEILEKNLCTEQRIPSVRDLSLKLCVNQNTVLKSYNQLKDENIIYEKRGLGYFVSENALQKISESEKGELYKIVLPNFFKILLKNKIEENELKNLYSNYIKGAILK